MALERFRHIVLAHPSSEEKFKSIGSGGREPRIPERDRPFHSNFLSNKLQNAWALAESEQAVAHVDRKGVYIEFKSDPGFDLVTKSLEDRRTKDKQIRLLNVRVATEQVQNEETGALKSVETTYATVYIPHEKKNHFLKKVESYANEINQKSGKPKNATLVNSIGDIRKALLIDSFWQDLPILQPGVDPEWCEVWLSSHTQDVLDGFETLLAQEQIATRLGVVRFPERAVKVIHATSKQLERLTTLSDDIAEYRRAKDTAAFWTEMENREQAEWVQDLLQRCHVDPNTNVSVCILDTGVNNGHPLLASILRDEDCLTINPEWGVHDHDSKNHGHGTLMAGVAAYGDLRHCLASRDQLFLRHCIESVKILPPTPDTNQPDLWGYITAQGISRADIQAPERKRIVCMAVTASDTRDRGRPSSWSGTLDQLTAGIEIEDIDRVRRLVILCAGNLTNLKSALLYPESQLADSVHDPAHAWNVLTVGACTALDRIVDETYADYKPIAAKNSLSPFSTTSSTWDNEWPLKPEIVMEGGNLAHDGNGFVTEREDLSLISTFWKPTDRYFYPFNMTSAAAAQAAWFAAHIQSAYPEIWPETFRALMVHSAEWTDALKMQFLPPQPTKSDKERLLRISGYGVPDLERALHSAANSLTLIAQAELQPYDKKEHGGYKTKEMHFYNLPWPKDVLLDLPFNTPVKMRVTLSYFIEPGPGEIGWKDRYRYASHALRFDVNSPGESKDDFLKRINKAAREEDEGHPGTPSASDHWVFGSNARNKGSIHSDIWQGSPAELANSHFMAVYPIVGWWRERHHLGKWNRRTRYSFVVTISTPEEKVDIYTPVANQVGITVPITVHTTGRGSS
ncbi:MAG: S8 family peptidase [Proteobacteria bacterium]|nr:S8 family peptidase [Pseudomonadota bacterium]MBU4010291.1 S8 family peptidase [Pseudomonadota bacterium]